MNNRNEEKELLLKDLCGRLPYVTYVRIVEADCLDKSESVTEGCVGGYSNTRMCQDYSMDEIFEFIESGDAVKPYLRSMSSMTEEEQKEYVEVIVKSQDCSYENNKSATTMVNDWYLSKGFDVRGLIPMGIALEAPEGMYETKTE